MEVSRIIAEIDAQIEKLQQARTLLAGMQTGRTSPGPGRPKGTKNTSRTAKQRRLSAAGRKAISDAMKRRWAERRKQSTKSAKSAAKS